MDAGGYQDIIIGVAAGVSVVILFLVAVGITILVKKKCRNKMKDPLSRQHSKNKDQTDTENAVIESPDIQLIDEDSGDDSSITLENVLDGDVWIDDMTGVMSHCIPILKGCHHITSRLVPITMKECCSHEDNQTVEEMALKIQPRLDDVIQLLQGPPDPRLVEARCTALFYAVSNLCLVVKSLTKDEVGVTDWIDEALQDTENHLQILQEETQRLRRRSFSGVAAGRGGGDDSSPVRELSLSGSHSRGGSSHTDSTESGIDVQTPSERGSEHTPQSPSTVTSKLRQQNDSGDVTAARVRHGSSDPNNSEYADAQPATQCCTIAEVHTNTSQDKGEAIEMKSFSNEACAVAD